MRFRFMLWLSFEHYSYSASNLFGRYKLILRRIYRNDLWTPFVTVGICMPENLISTSRRRSGACVVEPISQMITLPEEKQ